MCGTGLYCHKTAMHHADPESVPAICERSVQQADLAAEHNGQRKHRGLIQAAADGRPI